MRHRFFLIVAIVLIAPSPLLACLWDSDTLAMERRRFPQAHELIAGYFLKHSRAYYEWRLQDRLKIADADRTPGDFDDIAVSYEKLGDHDQAVAVIKEKMARFGEEGIYESHANLGTFLIHAGRYEEGLVHIDKAIEINPEAHFGREIYQKLLVEYLIERNDGKLVLPMFRDYENLYGRRGFAEFVIEKRAPAEEDIDGEIKAAIKGVLGMMRFGNYDSPVLLEALGDLLVATDLKEDARLLAARAYLKASYETKDQALPESLIDKTEAQDVTGWYRMLAQRAISMHEGLELADLEDALKSEIGQGDALREEIEAKQKAWIEAGEDVEAQFTATFDKTPMLAMPNPLDVVPLPRTVIYVIAGVVLLIVLLFVARLIRRKQNKPANPIVS